MKNSECLFCYSFEDFRICLRFDSARYIRTLLKTLIEHALSSMTLRVISELKYNFNYEHNKSCVGITWRDLIMEAEVFDQSAELSIVTGCANENLM